MRESNFCNPVQNRASVCISAAVYDRRAIDCTATLPLINSLNHLAYLTSTSPRIREMVTLDGGLERLIRILRTIPKSPSPHTRVISIKEMQAIWKWSLAFQCVVNIGVRGSESVRTRVVEAGMVPVTIRVLESYLRGMEKLKEERKKEAALQQHRREERRDERSTRDRLEPPTSYTPTRPVPDSRTASHPPEPTRPHQAAQNTTDDDASASYSTQQQHQLHSTSRSGRHHITDETRPITPLESNTSAVQSSVFVGMQSQSSADGFIPPHSSDMSGVDSNERHSSIPLIEGLNPVGLAPDSGVAAAAPDATPRAISTASIPLNHIDAPEDMRSQTGEASGSGSEGAEDAEMFADEADDSELDGTQGTTNISGNGIVPIDQDAIEDRQTPRPVRRALAPMSDTDPMHAVQPTTNYITPNRPTNTTVPPLFERQETVRPSRGFAYASSSRNAESTNAASSALAAQVRQENSTQDVQTQQQQASDHHHHHHHHHVHHREIQPSVSASRTAHIHATTNAAQAQGAAFAGPGASAGIDMIYREEEVLLSLQLLAYLSKYAHVRILFHTSDLINSALVGPLDALNEQLDPAIKGGKSWDPSEPPKRNVFSVAERFTLRSSRSSSVAYPAPRLSMEIQYWAGVIMRNACRKDESRGGIRQCANMLCGKWEEFPREFAKCRRCRKAKYCSKQCQSKGWQMGHRFWCSAKADDGDAKDKERERHSGRTEMNNITINPPLPGATDPTAPHPLVFGLDGQTPTHLHNIEDPMGNAGVGPHQETIGNLGIAPEQQPQAQQHLQQQHHHHHHLHHLHHAQHLHHHHQQQASRQHAAQEYRTTEQHQQQQNGQPQQHPHDNHQNHHNHLHHVYHHDNLSAPRPTSSSSSVSSQHVDPGFVSSADEGEESNPASFNASPTRPGQASTAGSSSHSAAQTSLFASSHLQTNPFASSTSSLSDGGPVADSSTGREARRPTVSGALGVPSSTHSQDLRNRRVASLASTDLVDNSDMSEDETERRLTQTEGIHPAIAAAAAAAGLHREQDVPPMAPQRTDLAGRPLPPPVIASHDGGEDVLALGGRATPGVAGEQDFATGEIDQMLGHWATRRNGAVGIGQRLAEIRAEVPSPERALSPDAESYAGSSEISMSGARSEEEEMAAPRARYHALFGPYSTHPSPLRGQTPQSHHRLHQPRSSGYNEHSSSNGQRAGYGESLGEPSILHGYRSSAAPSPSPLGRLSSSGGRDTYVATQIDRALHSPGVAPSSHASSEQDRVRAASYGGGDMHMPMDIYQPHTMHFPPAPPRSHPSSTGDDDVDMEM